MRILFVDDLTSRVDQLRDLLDQAHVEAAIDHRRAVREVAVPADIHAADVLFLDHDLCVAGGATLKPCPASGNVYQCFCPDGRDLVRRILASGVPPRRVVVHSANPTDGAQMAQMLRDAGWPVVYAPVGTWAGVTATGLLRRFRILDVGDDSPK